MTTENTNTEVPSNEQPNIINDFIKKIKVLYEPTENIKEAEWRKIGIALIIYSAGKANRPWCNGAQQICMKLCCLYFSRYYSHDRIFI